MPSVFLSCTTSVVPVTILLPEEVLGKTSSLYGKALCKESDAGERQLGAAMCIVKDKLPPGLMISAHRVLNHFINQNEKNDRFMGISTILIDPDSKVCDRKRPHDHNLYEFGKDCCQWGANKVDAFEMCIDQVAESTGFVGEHGPDPEPPEPWGPSHESAPLANPGEIQDDDPTPEADDDVEHEHGGIGAGLLLGQEIVRDHALRDATAFRVQNLLKEYPDGLTSIDLRRKINLAYVPVVESALSLLEDQKLVYKTRYPSNPLLPTFKLVTNVFQVIRLHDLLVPPPIVESAGTSEMSDAGSPPSSDSTGLGSPEVVQSNPPVPPSVTPTLEMPKESAHEPPQYEAMTADPGTTRAVVDAVYFAVSLAEYDTSPIGLEDKIAQESAERDMLCYYMSHVVALAETRHEAQTGKRPVTFTDLPMPALLKIHDYSKTVGLQADNPLHLPSYDGIGNSKSARGRCCGRQRAQLKAGLTPEVQTLTKKGKVIPPAKRKCHVTLTDGGKFKSAKMGEAYASSFPVVTICHTVALRLKLEGAVYPANFPEEKSECSEAGDGLGVGAKASQTARIHLPVSPDSHSAGCSELTPDLPAENDSGHMAVAPPPGLSLEPLSSAASSSQVPFNAPTARPDTYLETILRGGAAVSRMRFSFPFKYWDTQPLLSTFGQDTVQGNDPATPPAPGPGSASSSSGSSPNTNSSGSSPNTDCS